MDPLSPAPLHIARFLRMQPWFASLTPPAQERILRACTTVRCRKGDTLLRAGEFPNAWHAVLWGFVKLQAPAPDDQPSGFLALTGGEWFGEGSVLGSSPRRYEVAALRETELLCLPRATFHELLQTNLAFSNAVLHHMNQRLAQAMAIIEINRTRSLEQRVAMYLGPMFWHGLRSLNISQEELGSLAGISRQSTNRVLGVLAGMGLITLRYGRVVATDGPRLEAFAASAALREPLAA